MKTNVVNNNGRDNVELELGYGLLWIMCFSEVEFDDDIGQEAGEDDGDDDDGGEFDDEQDFTETLDVWRHWHMCFMIFWYI